ncbi:formyltetrahydrofolate deformylase [Pedococcus sp. NPDC057267]|uniref:formyltetrahydrofolate deformylase n=1 Tax=Pedococcus sp. NPDC057267 TaxID=3346077 RepID=UPI0036317444
MAQQFVLTLTCPEGPGIVHAVTSVLVENGCDITEHQQFDDPVHGLLFLRTCFTSPGAGHEALEAAFGPVAAAYRMRWELHDASRRTRAMVMVSRFGHCLNDLLYRWNAGSLGVDIALVVSNHEDLRSIAASAGVPFIHVPVTPDTKEASEARLLELVDRHEVDLVVLARYMQVLSDDLCKQLEGRAINIHHSFLPSFKGAKPYHQAYARGVKQVGATAHYVTPDLDEGPIIEQEVIRVDHTYGPEELVTAGRDAECLALARAVRWHGQHRVLLNRDRTVVFR